MTIVNVPPLNNLIKPDVQLFIFLKPQVQVQANGDHELPTYTTIVDTVSIKGMEDLFLARKSCSVGSGSDAFCQNKIGESRQFEDAFPAEYYSKIDEKWHICSFRPERNMHVPFLWKDGKKADRPIAFKAGENPFARASYDTRAEAKSHCASMGCTMIAEEIQSDKSIKFSPMIVSSDTFLSKKGTTLTTNDEEVCNYCTKNDDLPKVERISKGCCACNGGDGGKTFYAAPLESFDMRNRFVVPVDDDGMQTLGQKLYTLLLVTGIVGILVVLMFRVKRKAA